MEQSARGQTIQNWRVSSLEWAAGLYCLLIGAMMLVAPYRLSTSFISSTDARLITWGVLALLAGFSIFGVSVFPPPHWTILVAHIFTSALLLTLAADFFAHGSWLSGVNLLLLSLGLLAGGVVRVIQGVSQRLRPADLFGFVTGVAAIVTGVIFLLRPAYSPTVAANFNEGEQPVMGAFFLLGGILLVAYQIYAAEVSRCAGRSSSRVFHLFAYGLPGLANLITSGVSFVSDQWTSWALFGSIALVLVATPLVYRRMTRLTPTLLWPRVALGLAMVMGVPLILTVAVVHQQERQSVIDEAMQRQQSLALALALDVEDTIQLHQAAAVALSHDPDLLTMPPDQQRALLIAHQQAYPDVLAFALFDADGSVLARSDDTGSRAGVKGFPVYEDAQATGQPSLDVLISPVFHRPVFGIGAPIFDAQGRFAGLISISMASDDIAALLDTGGSGAGYRAYLVDEYGMAIAHPNSNLVIAETSLAKTEPVSGVMAAGQAVGTMKYSAPDGPRLVGYARVPRYGWAVVLERTEDDALMAVNRGSDSAYLILLCGMALTALGGAVIGRWMAGPLGRLSSASLELARGNDRVPLPSSRITEVDHLARAFGEMRDRLAQRTRERERAEDELRKANEALERRVLERTEALRAANERLQDELKTREKLMAQLDDERARLNSLIENAPTGILVIDELGRLVLTNRVADSLFGRDWLYQGEREQWRDLPLYENRGGEGAGKRCPPEDLPLARSLECRESVKSRELLYQPGGAPGLSLLCNAAPIFDAQERLVGAMMIFQDITEHKRLSEDLRRRQAQVEVQGLLIQHREDERVSIARDLHDGPLQELISASYSMAEAASVLRDEDARALLANVQRGLQRQISEMRTFLSELRPPALAPFGLEKAILSHQDVFSAKHPGIDLALDLDHDGQQLSEPVRLAVYRIYQEGLNNVVRHAQANRVSVKMRLNEETVSLTIEDNGRGFDVPGDWVSLARGGHLGLVGMRERVEALGGRLSLRSSPGTGTTLSVVVPRPKNDDGVTG